MDARQLVKSLPPDVRDELVLTLAATLIEAIGAPNVLQLLVEVMQIRFPGNVMEIKTPEELAAAKKAIRDSDGDPQAVKEAVAAVRAEAAIKQAAKH